MTYPGSTREPDDSGLVRRGLFARREPSPAEPLMTPDRVPAGGDRHERGRRAPGGRAPGDRGAGDRVDARGRRPRSGGPRRGTSVPSRSASSRCSPATRRSGRSSPRATSGSSRSPCGRARLEDHLSEVVESRPPDATRRWRHRRPRSGRSLTSPALHGVETVRTQLEQVELHIAEAFAHIDERDRHLDRDGPAARSATTAS